MFSNVAISAVAFIVALGILISIHEYGHFWVARRVGIKVLRYSIGFGRPLWKRRGKVDGTEYVIAAIPLGGYVKMLDEREESVAPEERHRAFNTQPLAARAAVVIAGPLANFVLAIAAYWLVFMMGISGVAPLIGAVAPDSAAEQAGFQFEDRLLSVNGEETPTWADARIALLEASLDASGPLPVEVEQADGATLTRQLVVAEGALLQAGGDGVAGLGFSLWWPQVDPVIGDVLDGPGRQAGLEAGDRILAVDGEPIATWQEFVAVVQPSAGKTLQLDVQRAGGSRLLEVTPAAVEGSDGAIGRIGVSENQSAALAERSRVVVSYPLVESLTRAVQRTWSMSVLTVRMLGKLVTGQASIDNISGPISIAQFAGQSATVGLDHYVNFIALISISLAVLNLLPIPMLDGGHLLYFAVEAVRGRPVSERVQIWGQQLGIVLLGSLMFVAFYNDLGRLLG